MIIVWATHRHEEAAQRALVLSATSIGFMLVFSPSWAASTRSVRCTRPCSGRPALSPSGWSRRSDLPADGWNRQQAVAAVVGVRPLLVVDPASCPPAWPSGRAGCWRSPSPPCSFSRPTRGRWERSRTRPSLAHRPSCCPELARRPRPVLPQPLLNAFNANAISDKLRTAVNAQEWLLAQHLARGHHPELGRRRLGRRRPRALRGGGHAAAGARTGDPGTGADRGRSGRWTRSGPPSSRWSAPTTDRVVQFWSSIPASLRRPPPRCYDFAGPTTRSPAATPA